MEWYFNFTWTTIKLILATMFWIGMGMGTRWLYNAIKNKGWNSRV